MPKLGKSEEEVLRGRVGGKILSPYVSTKKLSGTPVLERGI